jgi:hypothetical protein
MAVKALSSYSSSDPTITDSLKRGIEWLLRNQVGKGGWGLFPGDTPKSYSTALVVVSLKNIKEKRVVAAVNGGVEWLKQTLDSRGWNEAFDVICFSVWALGEKSEQVRSRISDSFQILEGEFAKKSPLDFAALSMLALSECNMTLEDPSLFQPFSYALQNQNSDGSWNPESKNKAGKTGTTSLVLLGYSRLGEANCLVCDSDMDNRLERAALLDLDNLHSKVYSRFQLLRKFLYAFLGFLGLSVSGIIVLAWETAILNQSDFLTLITAWISIFLVLCGGIIKYARISENK